MHDKQVANAIAPLAPHPPYIASLLSAGGQALWERGDLRSSRQWFDAAFQAAEIDGDGPGAASAALGLAGLWVDEHRSAGAASILYDRLHHGLTAVAPDSSLALRLR